MLKIKQYYCPPCIHAELDLIDAPTTHLNKQMHMDQMFNDPSILRITNILPAVFLLM